MAYKYEKIPANRPGKFKNEAGEMVILADKELVEERKGTKTRPPYTTILKPATEKDLEFGYEKMGMRTLIKRTGSAATEKAPVDPTDGSGEAKPLDAGKDADKTNKVAGKA
jgi:hypothetical protein